MIDYKKELNEEQLRVVLHGDGPCLVLAGAGSGKTRTITYRVAYLLEKGVNPNNILLVTFTNKAAKEMIHRVQTLMHDVETQQRAALSWAGTFHHVAYRILILYGALLGYKPNFSILDSEDSIDLLKLCIKQEGIDRDAKRFPSPKVIQSIISFARNAKKSISEVVQEKHPKWEEYCDTIVRIAGEYDKRKKQANVMDFDDLLVNLYILLLNFENVRQKFATQFEYVLVDEYQDTNRIQAAIIDLFASVHKNIIVVGDDAQSIYSFRAAEIQNILDFEKTYVDAKVFRLEMNYRSTPNILELANDVIKNNRNQYKKELKSLKTSFVKPEVHAFTDQSEEGEFVAQRILELNSEGVPLSHMAVLFRAAFHSQALEIELTKRNIPYDYRGGVRFFERAHIKDVLAFLRIFHNNEDVIAWSRVLNMQVGIGPAAAQKIIDAVQNAGGVGAQDFAPLLPARARSGFNDFISIYTTLQHSDGTPSGLILAVKNSKYKEYLEAEYPDFRERLQDIEQLALFAQRQPDLSKFLAEASLQESYATAQARSPEDEEEKLILSTIHQAKGLEWEAVFILNVSAGQFPSDRALNEDKGMEEERRLFYVAITRAKKYLYLSYPLLSISAHTLGGPSMFLEEIDKDLVEEHGAGGGFFGSNFGSTSFTDPSDEVDGISYVADEYSEEPFPSKKKPKPMSFLKSIDEL